MIVILLEPSSTVTDTDITCSVINKPWVQLQSGSLWKPVQASLKEKCKMKTKLAEKSEIRIRMTTLLYNTLKFLDSKLIILG